MADRTTGESKFKVHTFNSGLKWTGERTYDLTGESAPVIQGAPPSVFRGIEGKWSPEDLVLSGVNSCHASTFFGYAERKHFEFVSYESSAVGTLEHDGTNYGFSKIVLKPKVGVKSEEDIPLADQYLRRAKELCFMAHSVKAEVVLEPEIFVAS